MSMHYRRYVNSVADAIRDCLSDYVNPADFVCFEEFRVAAKAYREDIELEVTGNDNGSFFCSTTLAVEFIGSAVWDDDLVSTMREYGDIPTDPETWDVVARIAVFYDAWQGVMDEIEESFDDAD